MLKKIFKFTILAILLVLAGLGVYDRYLKPEDKPVYITEPAKRGSISKRVEASGEIYATELVAVGARIGGQIEKLPVNLGDTIKKGQLIVQLDSLNQQNLLNSRKATLAIYESQLEAANIAAQTSAQELARQEQLYKAGASSSAALQSARTQNASAQARVKEIKAQISQAKISVSVAELDLGYTRIVAPRDGSIVSVLVEEGQTISSAQTSPTIAHIADLSKMKMKIQIAEGDITKIKVGAELNYTVLSEPGRVFKAKISSIDPALTTMSDGRYSSTQSSSSSAVYYYAQAIVDNPEGLLRIGMSTQTSIEIGKADDAIIVPTLAIKRKGGKKTVSILKDDGSVEVRDVSTGISDNLRTQILSGINEGEAVITSQSTAAEVAAMVDKERH